VYWRMRWRMPSTTITNRVGMAACMMAAVRSPSAALMFR
jgi:hypothetical protein